MMVTNTKEELSVMKKLIVVSLVFVLGLSLVLGVSAKTESEAETAYNVMVNAKNEGRQLTADEIVEVEKVAKSLIMFNDNLTEVEKDQHRAISALSYRSNGII